MPDRYQVSRFLFIYPRGIIWSRNLIQEIAVYADAFTMIFDSGHWGKTHYIMEKALDVEALRREVIADNISNADTPHFKRSEVTFEASMRRALQSEEYVKKESVPTKRTDNRHFSFFDPVDYTSVKPRTILDYNTTMRNDGNNVDPEKEVQDMLKNQLRYQAIAQLMGSNNRTMYAVMRA